MNFRLDAVELVAHLRSRVSIVKITLSVRTAGVFICFCFPSAAPPPYSPGPTSIVAAVRRNRNFFPTIIPTLGRHFHRCVSPTLALSPPPKKSPKGLPFGLYSVRFLRRHLHPLLSLSAGSGSFSSFRQLRMYATRLKPAVVGSAFAIPFCPSRPVRIIIGFCGFSFKPYSNLFYPAYAMPVG